MKYGEKNTYTNINWTIVDMNVLYAKKDLFLKRVLSKTKKVFAAYIFANNNQDD